MKPLIIESTGMVTPVGYSAPASCAAMRVRYDGFEETKFIFRKMNIRGGVVRFETKWQTKDKLFNMAAMAANECLEHLEPSERSRTLLLLCLPEEDRPGRPFGLDETFAFNLYKELGLRWPEEPFQKVFPNGKVSGVRAISMADHLLGNQYETCVVVGVDSYLNEDTLEYYDNERRLLTDARKDGFVPGEAAGAVLLRRHYDARERFCIHGIGYGREKYTIRQGGSLKGDGLTTAINAANIDAQFAFEDLDYRISDSSMELYGFKEASLAHARTRYHKIVDKFDLWHVSDCIGEVGAAVVPICLGVAFTAACEGYAPGSGVICQFGNDNGERAAIAVRQNDGGAHYE